MLLYLALISLAGASSLLFEGRTTAVTELNDTTFQSQVNNTGTWVVLHYAHWCGHCVSFAPQYITLAETFRSEKIRFGAVDCASTHETCAANDVKLFPTLILFENGVRVRNIPKTELKKTIFELAFGSTAAELPNNLRQAESAISVISDASLAMRTLLEREVFRGATRELSGEALEGLKRLLEFCQALPLTKGTLAGCGSMHKAIIIVGDKLQRPEYEALVTKFVKDIDDEYESCKDFSCGMWRLLHLTSLAMPPAAAMSSMRFVVDSYFSCEACREHFLLHYDACDFRRPCGETSRPDEVILWLWRLHNSVNVRLGRVEWKSETQAVAALRELYGYEAPSLNRKGGGTLLVLSLAVLVLFGLYRAMGLVFPTLSLRSVVVRMSKKYQPII